MLQNGTRLRKSAPGPPNIPDEHVSCTAPATCLQILFKCPTPANAFETATKPSRLAHFWKGAQSLAPATQTTSERPKVLHTRQFFCIFWLRHVLHATTACTFSTSQLLKVVRSWCALHILTLKCASRHNGLHFFDIAASKSAPKLKCFLHFDLDMCFAPQRRAIFRHVDCQKCCENGVFCTFDFQMCFATQPRTLFRHVDCQKCSENGVLCTFWLRHVLRATTACNCSSLIWPDGSAPAALASLLSDPPEHKSSEKHSDWHLHLLSSDSFSSLICLLLLFSSLTLPTSAFSSIHTVGSYLYIDANVNGSKIFYYVFAGAQPLD